MKITFGRSVQVIQMGQPEAWNKAMVEDNVKENETESEAWERIVKSIYDVHDKYSKSFVEPSGKPVGDLYFNVSKGKEERG